MKLNSSRYKLNLTAFDLPGYEPYLNSEIHHFTYRYNSNSYIRYMYSHVDKCKYTW